MPIRKPVFDPPFNVVRASHVELAVRDLARARAFMWIASAIWSAPRSRARSICGRSRSATTIRSCCARPRSPRAQALGFKVASEEDLDRAAAWFRRRNLPTAFPEVPYQGRTLRTADVTGMPLEFYFKMDQGERMLQRYAAYQGARIQRIDHINCFTPDVQAILRLLHRARLPPDRIHRDRRHAIRKLWAVWLHRKGNVHDLAFTNGRGPRLHHIGVWTAGPLDILHICDVMATSGYLANMERGPGRHGISNAFFLYIRDPDGHRIELFTSDYLTVDPDLEPLRWSLTDPQRQTLWGHPAPKSWFEEGSEFSSVPVREPVLEARPIVAR